MNTIDYTLAKDFPLSDEQNEIIDFMIKKPQAVCAAQTGLGKTLTLLTAALILQKSYNDLHIVICCPQKALKVFKKELFRLNQDYNMLSSSDRVFSLNRSITIVTHTSLSKYRQELVDLRSRYRLLCILDEAHAAQDPETKFYQLMMTVRPLFAVFWAATATPLKNDISGLFWMINLVSPGYLGSWEAFKYNYLQIQTSKIRQKIYKGGHPIFIERTTEDIVGYRNIDRLKQLLNNIIILRQKKYNLEFFYHKVNLTAEEEHFYLMAGKGTFMKEETKDVWAARLHQLQRIVDNVHQDHYIGINSMSSKEKLLMQVLMNIIKEGKSCIIYFDYTEALERIEYLINNTKSITGIKQVLVVSGGVNQKQREKVEELINTGTVVLVTEAGTESINLQKASTIIFYDIPFAIQTFIQMVGRITRIDSKYDKQEVHFIEASGTSDTYRRIMVQINGDLIRSLFGNINTLPLDISIIDKRTSKQLRNALLWSFKQGHLASESEIESIIKKKLKGV